MRFGVEGDGNNDGLMMAGALDGQVDCLYKSYSCTGMFYMLGEHWIGLFQLVL